MKDSRFPIVRKSRSAIPVWFVEPGKLDGLKGELGKKAVAWAKANGFTGKVGTHCPIPGASPGKAGSLAAILFGHSADANPLAVGKLAGLLPGGSYRFANFDGDAYLASLGFVLGSYRFTRYRDASENSARLVLAADVDRDRLEREASAVFLTRDLVNTPANDLGPSHIENAVRKLATTHKARVSSTKGEALLKKNLPMIHAVGRAAADAPRLIDLKWGDVSHPKVTLVGKGVAFDTGGLNLKPGSSMALMKKDMGGAANVLGLASMIMAARLPVRLRVLVPAVENAISADAFRPGDVLDSRLGLTVEVGNTDAEGRLILADALALGDEENPQLMVDMATLTGAARVALGPELPPFYTDDEALAGELAAAAEARRDPMWRMPLWQPYMPQLDSKIADISHITATGFAGSVTAALFLKKFVRRQTPWVHFDIFAWVPNARPWAPVGGEAQCIRALYEVIAKRYA